MDSYVTPLISVFVICCFFLSGLLITAFFCFNIYSELTTLWEAAHSLLERYILRSASFQEAYTKLSALLQHEQDGLVAASAAAAAASTAAAAAAAEGTTAAETPTTIAGFVAAAASAVRSSAANSGGAGSGSSIAATLLGGSLGWYSDLWRTIQELASASSAANAAAAAAADDEPALTSLPWPSAASSRHMEAPLSVPVPATGTVAPGQMSPIEMTATAAARMHQQQQNLSSFVPSWAFGHKAQHLLFTKDACPRLPGKASDEADMDLEGPPSPACIAAGDPQEALSPTCMAAEPGWWLNGGGALEGASGQGTPRVANVETFLALLHDESSLSCIDPWGPPGGPYGDPLGPPLGFAWADAIAAKRREAAKRGGGGSGYFLSFIFPADLWRRWPNTAELLGHLRRGNFLSAFRRSLEASQELYSLTSEAWWRYLSEHAHTLLAWVFNSG